MPPYPLTGGGRGGAAPAGTPSRVARRVGVARGRRRGGEGRGGRAGGGGGAARCPGCARFRFSRRGPAVSLQSSSPPPSRPAIRLKPEPSGRGLVFASEAAPPRPKASALRRRSRGWGGKPRGGRRGLGLRA